LWGENELLSVDEARQLLEKFLQSKDEQQDYQLMGCLLHDFAMPIINAILRRKFGVDVLHRRRMEKREVEMRECSECKIFLESDLPVCPLCGAKLQSQTSRHSHRSSLELDVEDLFDDVVAALIERFWQWKDRPKGAPLDYLRNYITRLTFNIIALHWRRRFPHRYQLRNKLLYLLEGRGGKKIFALWEGDAPSEQLCGFFEWRGKPRCHSERYWLWCSDPHHFVTEALPYGSDPQKMDISELLAYVFNWVGGPMEFDDLLAGLCELLNIQDTVTYVINPDELENEEATSSLDEVEKRLIDAEQKRLLTLRVWEGLNRLPINQRRAFLLARNQDELEAFIFHGCCTWNGIAEMLGISLRELKSLIARLPLSDEEISKMLGLSSRQKVINLRHSAIKTLRRWVRKI